MKNSLILAICLSFFSSSLTLAPHVQESSQAPHSSSTNDLARRLEAELDARKSGDPVAIARASQQVIALGLVQMAKIRLDAKAYDDVVKLCSDSLEFEDTAETRVELAIANLYAKKPSDAAKQASTATEMDPQNALAWTLKGEALLRIKDYAGATSALERSIELKKDAEPLYALGMAQLGAGEKQKAAKSLANLLGLIGDAGWSRVLIGRAYQQQDLPHEAVVEFQNALRLDPRTPNAHYFWAWTLLQANSWSMTPEARLQLQEELKLNPRHFLSIYLLAVFASIERNYDESDRYLHLAIALNPSVPEIWMYLGLNENGRKARQKAESYLRKAILLTERGNPKEHWSIRQAYFVLGRLLVSSGRKKEGEELIKKGQELQDLTEGHANFTPERTTAGNSAAGDAEPYVPEPEDRNPFSVRISRATTNSQDTRRDGRPLIGTSQDPLGKTEKQLSTLLASSFNDLATAEALQENYERALKHYREAAGWDSRIPGLQRNLGLAAFFAGQPEEAIRLLHKVVTAKPDAQARKVLGLAYFATRDFAKAVQTIAPISDQAAQDPQLGFAWAKSLAKTGNRKAATRALQRLDKPGANLRVENLIQFGKLWQDLGESARAAQCFQRVLLIDPENLEAQCALDPSKCP